MRTPGKIYWLPLALLLSVVLAGPALAAKKGDPHPAGLREQAAIARTVELYIEGGRQGSSKIMRQAFHEGANIYANVNGQVLGGPIQALYDLVDGKPPAGNIDYELASVEYAANIATVRLEIANWAGAHYTDMFTLLKIGEEWKIISKVSYVHPKQ